MGKLTSRDSRQSHCFLLPLLPPRLRGYRGKSFFMSYGCDCKMHAFCMQVGRLKNPPPSATLSPRSHPFTTGNAPFPALNQRLVHGFCCRNPCLGSAVDRVS